MAETEALTDVMRLLRAWDAGASEAGAPPANTLGALGTAMRLGVGEPVAAALEPRLPPAAARLTLTPVRAAAARAAEAAAAQLASIGRALEAAGLSAVALKGAAFVAEQGRPAPWRPMVDLDLLVPRADLEAAVAALVAEGYAGEHAAHVATDYHYPALLPSGPGLSVELHVDLGWRRTAPLDGLAARAAPGALPGLRVPTPGDRLAHLVHHAQIADGGHAARVVPLRAALDWRRLTRDAGADPAAARARFDAAGLAPAFDAFAAFAAAVWDEPAPASPAARRWAEDALAALAEPGLAARRARRFDPRRAFGALTEPRLMAHAAAVMLNPVRLRRLGRGLMDGLRAG
ncbi:MAG: nucleotidyltransferase family protein [Paracoccaceae bacterium]